MSSDLGLILSLLHLTGVVQGFHYSCPTSRYTWRLNSLCIQVHYNEVDWDQARAYCRESGGDLLEIRSRQMQQFVVTHLKNSGRTSAGFWFGATDRKHESKWEWLNAGNVAMHYTNWATDQGPRHPGFLFGGLEDCALMKPKTGYTWHDAPCAAGIVYHYAFLCQFNAIHIPEKPHIKITTHSPKPTTTIHKTKPSVTYPLSTAAHIPEGSTDEDSVSNTCMSGALKFALCGHRGECPSCINETDTNVCSSHTTVCRGAEACYLRFTKDGASAGCMADSIQCYRNMSHLPAECNYRPIPFKTHPALNCLYCCDLSKENCFEGLLKLVVYNRPSS